MSETDLPPIRYRLPITLQEQLGNLPLEPKERDALAEGFSKDVSFLMDSNGIEIKESSFRIKTDESILAKMRRKPLEHQANPIVDIFGTRFVIQEKDIDKAVEVLKEQYNPPDVYPWGLPFCLDHRINEFKSAKSSPDYKAVHLYLPFGTEEILSIGEVQLLTPEWKNIADETRGTYEEQKFR